DPVGTAAALMIAGWAGGFIGVTIEPPAAEGEPEHLHKTHPGEVLSAAGPFIANAAGFIAAWLFLSHAPSTIAGAMAIGFWWLFSVTLQISAGVLARLRAVDPGIP
ncbi:MAG: hypothetical protein ACXU9D_09085, partial [Xanthobacteraceae bacterium]